MIENIKNIWIYDLEVFAQDWLAVFQSVDNPQEVKVYHNDRAGVLEYLKVNKPVLCGFNNKHYDDYIMLSILNSGDPEQVKAHNDWIISGNQGFEFKAIEGEYKGNWFESFDVKDDLPMDLSLKAIEGNLGFNIVESEVDFNIKRKLTDEELQQTIYYCKQDVKNTLELFKHRKAYLDGKLKVAKVGEIPAVKALGMTNPKLAAYFLGAKALDNPTAGELEYTPPDCLKLAKYTEALEFYKTIDYTKSLSIQAKDLQLDYGWGGLHGAIPNSTFKESSSFKIVDIDVGSYYPSMILRLGYYPTSIPSPKGYEEVYNQRLYAKHTGDSDTADALKLVLNSTYGALKNKYNPLFEPRVANHICISGQLLLTDLIEKLESIPSVKLIQANTDGIMLGYNPQHSSQVEKIVLDWEQRTGLNMEYTEIHSITQKDVNNYVMVQGATYLIKPDFSRQYTKEDKHKVAVKGSYVSLCKGGDFKNNSLVIVAKAITEYFLNGTPAAETIKKADNILDFAMVCKTGHTYDGCVYDYAGKFMPVQRANRVYASKDTAAGTLYKLKGSRKDKIASIPDHCLIDNTGSSVKLSQIDKNWYIQLAEKRINDYLGIKEKTTNKKKEQKKMADKKVNVYQKLAKARMDFLASPINKTGKNRHIGFKYFTLDDIVPVATKVFTDNGLLFLVNFSESSAFGSVINVEDPQETIEFTSPIAEVEPNKGTNPIQVIGATQTYIRRYLWLMALDIVEHDTYDEAQKDEAPAEEKPVKAEALKAAPKTPEERKEIAKELSTPATDEAMTALQKKSIKKGLNELNELDNYAEYISGIVKEMKAGNVSSARAEEIITQINKYLYPEE